MSEINLFFSDEFKARLRTQYRQKNKPPQLTKSRWKPTSDRKIKEGLTSQK